MKNVIYNSLSLEDIKRILACCVELMAVSPGQSVNKQKYPVVLQKNANIAWTVRMSSVNISKRDYAMKTP